MYILTVVLLAFVFPVISILTDVFLFKSASSTMYLVGKWFVFWGVGIRFFTAGLRQSITPRFTAEKIFGFKTDEPLVFVQELGFANISSGLLGILTIFDGNWILPSAIIGGSFYGLAGIKHLTRSGRSSTENVTTYSDLLMSIILLVYVARSII
ncbi:MAG TPA: DUF6790 family protein [Candidatus Acidoferrales bacterium]|nr:DUF6790 family protein [Candidatus Acidoferrales bacterium]